MMKLVILFAIFGFAVAQDPPHGFFIAFKEKENERCNYRTEKGILKALKIIGKVGGFPDSDLDVDWQGLVAKRDELRVIRRACAARPDIIKEVNDVECEGFDDDDAEDMRRELEVESECLGLPEYHKDPLQGERELSEYSDPDCNYWMSGPYGHAWHDYCYSKKISRRQLRNRELLDTRTLEERQNVMKVKAMELCVEFEPKGLDCSTIDVHLF